MRPNAAAYLLGLDKINFGAVIRDLAHVHYNSFKLQAIGTAEFYPDDIRLRPKLPPCV